MKPTKTPFSLLTEDQRRAAISNIVDYFTTELVQEIGVIAAEDILEMFLEQTGPQIFNRGVEEAKKVAEVTTQNLQIELEVLKRDES